MPFSGPDEKDYSEGLDELDLGNIQHILSGLPTENAESNTRETSDFEGAPQDEMAFGDEALSNLVSETVGLLAEQSNDGENSKETSDEKGEEHFSPFHGTGESFDDGMESTEQMASNDLREANDLTEEGGRREERLSTEDNEPTEDNEQRETDSREESRETQNSDEQKEVNEQKTSNESNQQIEHVESSQKDTSPEFSMEEIPQEVLDQLANATFEALHAQDNSHDTSQNNSHDSHDSPREEDEGAALQAALAQMVQNVVEENDTGEPEEHQEPVRESAEPPMQAPLEAPHPDEIDYNQILQNAMRMASDNPADLLANMELPAEFDVQSLSSESAKLRLNEARRQLNKKKPTPNKITFSQSTVGESGPVPLTAEEDASRSSMSIAETLALTRSRMLNRPTPAHATLPTSDKHSHFQHVMYLQRQNSQSRLSGVPQSTLSAITAAVTAALSNMGPHRDSHVKERSAEDLKEKIRLDNRERKKKWREINAERNKDNDLRSRVQKRANALFGMQNTEEKLKWTDQEYEKRRRKRIEKEVKGFRPGISSIPLKSETSEDESKDLETGSLSRDPQFASVLSTVLSSIPRNDNTSFGTSSEVKALITNVLSTIFSASSEPNSVEDVAGLPKGSVSSFKVNMFDDVHSKALEAFSNVKSLLEGNSSDVSQIASLVDNKSLMQDLKSGLSQISAGDGLKSNLASSISALENLSLRKDQNFTTDPAKRKQSTGNLSEALKKPRTDSASPSSPIELKSEDSLPAVSGKSTSSALSHLVPWSGKNALKMPQYKKPERQNGDKKTPSLGLGLSIGLRKPGAFQRPGYSKPGEGNSGSEGPVGEKEKKNNKMGFPPLLSAALKN